MLKKLKRAVLNILVLPQYLRHKANGVPGSYEELANFFRYIPFGTIKHETLQVEFFFRGKSVVLTYGYLTPLAAAIFGNNEYSLLDVKGSDVVDVGASLGDTAIYFAMQGANHVYAYELNLRNFNLAEKNIKQNNLSKSINIYHCGVASHKIDPSEAVLSAIMPKEDSSEVGLANFKTLNQIAEDHNLSDAILKVDVDGYEYDIFRNSSNETLRKFKSIFIEYHFGIQDLRDILFAAGFNVTAVKVNEIYAPHHAENFRQMDIGYIQGSRI